MPKLDDIIIGCKNGERSAQCLLYELFSPRMRAVSFRYVQEIQDVEDILHDVFLYVLTHIRQYKGTGSFEGWLRRIVVGTAIKHLQAKRKKALEYGEEILEKWEFDHIDLRDLNQNLDENFVINPDDFSEKEIFEILRELPEGYRIVFNLYVFEKYTHKEIASELGISLGTSKSQLNKARKVLQKLLISRHLKKQKEKERENYRNLFKVVI